MTSSVLPEQAVLSLSTRAFQFFDWARLYDSSTEAWLVLQKAAAQGEGRPKHRMFMTAEGPVLAHLCEPVEWAQKFGRTTLFTRQQ